MQIDPAAVLAVISEYAQRIAQLEAALAEAQQAGQKPAPGQTTSK